MKLGPADEGVTTGPALDGRYHTVKVRGTEVPFWGFPSLTVTVIVAESPGLAVPGESSVNCAVPLVIGLTVIESTTARLLLVAVIVKGCPVHRRGRP